VVGSDFESEIRKADHACQREDESGHHHQIASGDASAAPWWLHDSGNENRDSSSLKKTCRAKKSTAQDGQQGSANSTFRRTSHGSTDAACRCHEDAISIFLTEQEEV